MQNDSEINNNIYQKNGQINCQTSFLSRSNSSNTTAMQGFETKPDTGNSIKKLSEGESGSLILSFNLNLCNGKSLITSPVQLITRMLRAQVGGIMTSAMYATSLITSRKEIPHKCARVESRKVGNNQIPNVTKNKKFSTCKDGQHGCTVQSSEDGRDKKSKRCC